MDTGVSTVGFAENAEGFEITFEATSFPLPIVQGPADFHLPTECIVSSLAVNRAAGWRIIDHVGFNLSQINTSDTFLQVTNNYDALHSDLFIYIDSWNTITWSAFF